MAQWQPAGSPARRVRRRSAATGTRASRGGGREARRLPCRSPGYWFFALTFTNATNSLMQLSTEPATRGRVMALRVGIALGGTPIGAPIVGGQPLRAVLGARFSPRPAGRRDHRPDAGTRSPDGAQRNPGRDACKIVPACRFAHAGYSFLGVGGRIAPTHRQFITWRWACFPLIGTGAA